jgi:hypothetical protein
MRIQSVLLTLMTCLMVLLSSCGDDALAPFEPEIANVPDNFQFQATKVSRVSLTRDYTWQNSGSMASVDHSSAITGGSASVTIFDADGTQVYTSALKASGTEDTSVGTSGAWRIRVVLSSVSGTLNFRVQMK